HKNLTDEKKLGSGWGSGLYIDPRAVPGGTGQYALNGLVVKNNDFQNLTFAPSTFTQGIVNIAGTFDANNEQFSGNRYFGAMDPSTWFDINGGVIPWSAWQST